jgi:hypothetical protein
MTDRPLRAGPWPGLTPLGAVALLCCAALLGVGQLLTGQPRQPQPDLVVLGVCAFVPLMLAARVVGMPGAAAAACGAYLLPRTLLSLVDSRIEPPPLLLVPALAFELAAWLRASDLAALGHVWPRTHKQRAWRSRDRRPRQLTWRRGTLGGTAFGIVLSAIEPPFAVLLGADPATWSGINLWLAAALCTAACTAIGAGLSARGTAS